MTSKASFLFPRARDCPNDGTHGTECFLFHIGPPLLALCLHLHLHLHSAISVRHDAPRWRILDEFQLHRMEAIKNTNHIKSKRPRSNHSNSQTQLADLVPARYHAPWDTLATLHSVGANAPLHHALNSLPQCPPPRDEDPSRLLGAEQGRAGQGRAVGEVGSGESFHSLWIII